MAALIRMTPKAALIRMTLKAALLRMTPEAAQPSREKLAFRNVSRPGDCQFVRRGGLDVSSEAAEEVGAHRMEQSIVLQVECLDQREPRRRPLDLRNGHRSVQRDNRTRRDRHVQIIKLDDLPPVRRRR